MKLEKLSTTESTAAQLLKVTADSLAPPHSLFGKLKAISNPPLNSVEQALKRDIQEGKKVIPTRDGKFIISIRNVGSTGRYHVTAADAEGQGIMSKRVDVPAERKAYARELRKRLGLKEPETGGALDSNKKVALQSASLSGRNLSGMSLALCNLRGARLEDSNLEGADLRYTDLAHSSLSRAHLCDADLSGAKLKEARLCGAILSGATLTGSDLSGKDLSWSSLSCARLDYANLHGTDLSRASLRNASLENADLRDANLGGANLNGANLAGANLTGADLTGGYLTGCNLNGANLSGTNLKNVVLQGLDLSGVNLRGADLNGNNMEGIDLSGINLSGASLRGAKLRGTDLTGANLSGADLSGNDLEGINLRGVNLRGASLKGVKLAGVDLRNVDLSGVSLAHANLTGFDLSGVELKGVDLRGAKLSGHDLSAHDLSGVNLRGANLSGVNLSGHDLSKLKLQETDLSKVDLSSVSLSGSNLNGVFLIGNNLSGRDLSNVSLMHATLRDVKLDNANLEGANLTGTRLCDVDLSGANLSGAKLRNTEVRHFNLLKNVNLRGANLSRADLSDHDLSGFDLSGTNLIGINLHNTKLDGVNLQGYDLSEANLRNVVLGRRDMKGTKLSGANLEGARLLGGDFRVCDLSKANLRNVDLSRLKLGGSNLRGANLEGACLEGANLRGCDLRGARLTGVKLDGVDLTRVKLDLVPEGLQWNDWELDVQLNHHNNRSGSLLSTLDSIDERFEDIKIAQAHLLMESLSSQGIQPDRLTSVALPLLEVLGRQPYSSDPALATWMVDIAAARIESHGAEGMAPKIADFCLSVFENAPDKMLQQNVAFHHLIHSVLNAGNPASVSRAEAAYATYLALPEVTPYTAFAFFERANSGSPDAPAQVSLQKTDEVNLALWPATTGGPVMLLSRDTYQNMQKPDPQNPVWDRFFLMNTPDTCVPTADVAPEALFRKDFPQFLGPFLSEQRKNGFGRLLDTLNLGHYRESFVSAMKVRSAGTKMVGAKEQTDLDALFSHTLQPGKSWGGLTEEHAQEIVQAYGLGGLTKREQAQFFLCLSAMFARFSSSHFFGTENESPTTLRTYAHALMLKSLELDRGVSGARFSDWQNKFQKRAGAFDCTALLSSDMTAHINQTCPQVLATIRPAAWA